MNPHEFYTYLEGRRESLKQEDYRRSYFVSALLSTQTKNPVTADQLYEPLWYTQEEIDKRHQGNADKERERFLDEFDGVLKKVK